MSTHSFTNLAAHFKINDPDVIAETIDGEVIIINLNSGAYYSSLGSGGAVWQALMANYSIEEAITWIADSYGAERTAVEAEVSQFVAHLVNEGLLVELNEAPMTSALAPTTMGAFESPVLSKYTDMQELLLLDPIHDVDPSVGWPFPKATE